MRKRIALFVFGSLLSFSAMAEANGRYPFGNQLIVHPHNPNVIMVRTTFGLLLSDDHGASFRWICESLIGFTNGQDPGVGMFGDGAYAVAGYNGLYISHDNACSFPTIGGVAANQYVIDIAVDKDAQGAVAVSSHKLIIDGGTTTASTTPARV